MQALDFFNDFMQWLGELAPRWDLLEPTHGGLKFKPGGKVEELKPGHIYWWWPVTTKVRTIPIKRDALTIGQRLTTDDDVTVAANIVVVYEVDDVRLAILETNDFDNNLSVIGQELSIKPIMSREFHEIVRDMAQNNDLRKECTNEARKALKPFGVKVIRAYVSDFTETTVFSHDGDGLVISQGEDDDDDE